MARSDNPLKEAGLQLVAPKSSVGDNSADHLMPGIVPQIVDTFLRPRQHFSTRGVARIKKVSVGAVNTALFRALFTEINELRDLVGRKPPATAQRSAGFGLVERRRTA